MRFSDPRLQTALDAWRRHDDILERARADNTSFEERVSDARLARFEAMSADPDAPGDLDLQHVWYWKNHVRSGVPVSDTFASHLEPATLGPGPLEPFQPIVRIERLNAPLQDAGLTFDELRRALNDPQPSATVDMFLRVWNDGRDDRPAFAAWKDQVLEEVEADDWADRLRDRLGLAHYDPSERHIPVALMEYTVDDVTKEAARRGLTRAFTAPTVLDCEPWPYFFPAPKELAYGRAMPLYQLDDERQLLAEMLHTRLTYQRHHLIRVGEIKRRPGASDLKDLRNHHLLLLRFAAERLEFGEEMP